MKITQIHTNKPQSLSFEIFPPKKEEDFKNIDEMNPTASFADYAKSSYQKVLKDLENLQMLIDKLDGNEPSSMKMIS